MIKRCARCGESKELSEFHRMSKSKDGRHPYCKPCKSAYARVRHYTQRDHELENMRRWRERNHEYVLAEAKRWYDQNKEHVRDREALRIAQKRELITFLKMRPCLDCGREFPPVCMDFDHVTGEKRGSLSRLVRLSVEVILDEIAKCEVVCANCHRIRTQSRGQYHQVDWKDVEHV